MALSLSEIEKLSPEEASVINSLKTGRSLDNIESRNMEEASDTVSSLVTPLAGPAKAAIGLGVRGFTSILKTKNTELGKTYSTAQKVAQQMGLRGTNEVTPEWINANKELLTKTGWEMNMDGTLYQAIPGADKAKLIIGETSKEGLAISKGYEDLYSKTSSTLGNTLDWPELYKSFPELKDMPVKSIIGNNATKGRFTGDSIELAQYQTPEKVKETLLHEVTHAAQFIEGMVNGTNADYILSKKYGVDLKSFHSERLSAVDDIRSVFDREVVSTRFSTKEQNLFMRGMTKLKSGDKDTPINKLTPDEAKAVDRVNKLPEIEQLQVMGTWKALEPFNLKLNQANKDYYNMWGEGQARAIADHMMSSKSVTERIVSQVEKTGGPSKLVMGERFKNTTDKTKASSQRPVDDFIN